MFIFGPGSGNDTVHGGGGSWTDTIQLNEVSTPPGDGDWTLATDADYTVDADNGVVLFDGAASGTIELPDGSVLDFDGIERIEW